MTQALSNLPIGAILEDITASLKLNSQLIIQAPPGAGKSTFLPLQLLLDPQWQGKIIMLEPRRLAAKSIANFIAKQLGEAAGHRVGYRIRGESKTSASTRLEIVTEGILTRMIQSDPELSGVELLLFDEFHERSIHADLGLALALEVQQVFNEQLKIVVMSATLDQAGLHSIMPDAAIHTSEGRGYPIEQRYAPLKPNQNLIAHICQQTNKAINEEGGSILVFLPSVGLINACLESLTNDLSQTNRLKVLPLHGGLDFAAQQQAIQPCNEGERKVVLTTNIAETSLTIEGVRIVIDSGLENRASFDLSSGITRLEQKWISQASAIQRAGRAGRTEPGICIRLFSESQFNQNPSHTMPEILRSDLAPLMLEAVQWGSGDLTELQFVDQPSTVSVSAAAALLQRLTLLTSDLTLTQQGKQALQLGLEPRLGAMLSRAPEPLFHTALVTTAVWEEPMRNNDDTAFQVALFADKKHPKQGALKRRIENLAARCQRKFSAASIQTGQVGVCLSFAFPDRIGQRRSFSGHQYQLSSGHGAFVDENSRLSSDEYLAVANLQKGRQSASRVLAAAPISLMDLETYHHLEQEDVVQWSDEKQAMLAEHQVRLGQLVIKRKPISPSEISSQVLAKGLLNYIAKKGLQILPWNKDSQALRSRVNCARAWLPEKEWPNWSDQGLLNNIEEWLLPHLDNVRSVKALQRLNMLDILNAELGWPLNQEINTLLPKALKVPSGSTKAIHYSEGQNPKLSIKLQEMFGEPQSPTVAQGRVKVTLELLSPAQRPLQVTQDLEGFWNGAYKEVQKEMKGRYPKHPWPDDPASHQATSKTKRHLK
ncbi:ATP-dependent helicase HrpB [Vibrio inusitatus NBRC 102082]|uniref:ATP-dependent helicase HrpB n=1 Tax=Vibrio inusitatus NBRC 102082 TaxID=1219070 RepID=A0A4Y3I0G7_9VIBR|nr:ATP-dependent helicase HrpB [Vibrio inusitatus]GEA52728.1 ATP-dependent helicase HrpB [Vibrio inusitatus NBRC 102082]